MVFGHLKNEISPNSSKLAEEDEEHTNTITTDLAPIFLPELHPEDTLNEVASEFQGEGVQKNVSKNNELQPENETVPTQR